MFFVNQLIPTPLTVGGEVAVFQVVADEALVTSGVVVFKYGDREEGKVVHVHLIWG